MALKVGNKYRTNSLSRKPGGVTVITKNQNGQLLEYTNVKYPTGYIKKILENSDIIDAWVKE